MITRKKFIFVISCLFVKGLFGATFIEHIDSMYNWQPTINVYNNTLNPVDVFLPHKSSGQIFTHSAPARNGNTPGFVQIKIDPTAFEDSGIFFGKKGEAVTYNINSPCNIQPLQNLMGAGWPPDILGIISQFWSVTDSDTPISLFVNVGLDNSADNNLIANLQYEFKYYIPMAFFQKINKTINETIRLTKNTPIVNCGVSR